MCIDNPVRKGKQVHRTHLKYKSKQKYETISQLHVETPKCEAKPLCIDNPMCKGKPVHKTHSNYKSKQKCESMSQLCIEAPKHDAKGQPCIEHLKHDDNTYIKTIKCKLSGSPLGFHCYKRCNTKG